MKIPRIYLWALAAYSLLAALFIHDWDGFVFERTVRDLWAGTSPYAIAHDPPWYSLLGIADHHPQWYAYPPLALLAMAVTFSPAILFDLPEPLQRVLLKLPMILGTLALAWVAGAWTRHLGRAELAPRVEWLFLANPFLVLVGPIWGMTDTILVAFLLWSALKFMQGRDTTAGVLFAMALLVKPFPVLLAIPLLAWLLARGHARRLPRFALAGATTALLVCLPFILADWWGFYTQAVGGHLGRATQGLSIWAIPPLGLLPDTAQRAGSMVAVAAALALVSVWATRRQNETAPLEIIALGSAAFLLANRVLNEQYLVLVVAPLLVLAAVQLHWARPVRVLTGIYAATVVLVGFHFLTFIPPDIALAWFGRPVDEVAEVVRQAAPWLWTGLNAIIHIVVPASLIALCWLFWRHSRDHVRPRFRAATPSVLAAVLLAIVTVTPAVVQPHESDVPFQPAFEEPRVASFYYLWWHNPSFDPGTQYGNWFPISQHPSIGYYTNNRGIASLHAEMMVDNGIDTAIISFHRGEEIRYRVFHEEATRVGLWTTPLIELNQIYDLIVDGEYVNRPMMHDGTRVPNAAYRMSDWVHDEIIGFVLDIQEQISSPTNLRMDDRPVVMFYDSYVSALSFDPDSILADSQALLDRFGIEGLRDLLDDPNLEADAADIARHFPEAYSSFFEDPRTGPWRQAHLDTHHAFWTSIRNELESVLGPLYLVSGEAFNERAGFEAGTIKSITNLDLFDASFIYSPSFTWGNAPDRAFMDNFHLWEDRNHWMQAFARGAGRDAIVGIAPAYDDTVNRPERGFIIPAVHAGVSTYDRSWQSMINDPPRMVGISTFNEYFEGSSIEPSVEFGDNWLLDTAAHRERLLTIQAPQQDLYVVVNEHMSRMLLTETDDSHFWGLDLIAAAARTTSDLRLVAADATWRPMEGDVALALVEGGRHGYHIEPAMANQLVEWAQDGTPVILLGPEHSAASGLAVTTCPPLDVPAGSVTLQPGDLVHPGPGGVFLTRAGTTYHVGAACDGFSFLTFKPLGHDALTDAACLAVAIEALAPGVVRPPVPACAVLPRP